MAKTDLPDARLAAALAASARSGIPSFIVMDVMRAAAAKQAVGAHIIHMEVGQPSTPAPRLAREAAKSALDTQTLGYTQALGNDALRARIAEFYRATYGVRIAPSRIIVTAGSSAAFVLAFLATLDPGRAMLLPNPSYPCYRHILTALGNPSVAVTTSAETRWMPEPDAVAAAAKASQAGALLIASPANPTGTMIDRARLEALIAVCAAHRAWFISDEIYHGLTYDGSAITALAVSDDAIVINSFSKYFSMTGWRVGWMVVPERLVRPIERLAQNFYISPPAIAQVAALAAFDAGDELEANRRRYAANRALLLAELPQAGFATFAPADGAFYLYADIGDRSTDSLAFARRMLDETGVAATPGVDFDPERGDRFLRFSYAGATADMADAASRLSAWKR